MRHGSHDRTPSVAEVVHRAVAVCDPDGDDELIAAFLLEFEDRDEPVTALDERDRTFFEAAERLRGAMAAAGVEMTAAVATYLAFRRDEIDDDDDDLLRLATRAEYGDDPPEDIKDWLQDVGVTV
ncbi:MAG TPA: hypothetical protein VG474_08625 [Solirubrobacteraceae bacterium]|nr:hypothetical protein [Solirubrobacteraceae bacterium]